MSPVSAREITHTIVDSVQLTVDGPALQTERIGGQYSVSGSNITASTLGGFDATFTSGAPDHVNGSYAVTNAGSAFTFSESITLGDTITTDQAALTSGGRLDEQVRQGARGPRGRCRQGLPSFLPQIDDETRKRCPAC